MLLSLVVHTHSLRYWFPATVMLGTAPVYLLSWGAWRFLSTFLPSRLYHTLDDRLYCIYQSMVLFFFENYTGVEASMSYACTPVLNDTCGQKNPLECCMLWNILWLSSLQTAPDKPVSIALFCGPHLLMEPVPVTHVKHDGRSKTLYSLNVFVIIKVTMHLKHYLTSKIWIQLLM